MANVTMKAYKVSEIIFNNKVNGKVQLKLSNKVSHNVRYNKGGACEAFLTAEVFDKENKDVLNVKVTVVGAFSVNSEVEKEFLHVETFKELFPFAKALVTTISANAGVPPIYLQNVDIEKQEIYRFDMNANKEEE
ncbi:MAG: protein-export chaperone SecB [Acutalibacteraceae bacterium]|nr:protein-export chaperone SecB [Acutalibacteraceae bacterium]